MAGRDLMRRGVAMALTAVGMLTVATPAHSVSFVPGYYTIQAQQPFPTAPRLFVGAASSSTTQPLRLMSGNIADPIQRQRVQWRLAVTSHSIRGKRYTAYNVVNRHYNACATILQAGPLGRSPNVLNGRYVGLEVCGNFYRDWLFNNGSRWVVFSDPHGQRVGFQLNAPSGPERGTVYCLDVTNRQYVAGNHLQTWRCTGAWNQRFIFRRAG